VANFGVNIFFSSFLMQIFDVLGMKISAFESKRQEEYLDPKLMTCAPI